MKKLFLILAVTACFGMATANVKAQDVAAAQTEQITVDNPETDVAGKPLHQEIKRQFLEGGAGWMAPILIFLILGLAISIERIIYLNLSTVNSKKLIGKVEAALQKGGVEEAKRVVRDTKGPIASIFYQGLDRYDQGMDNVEKAVVSYGSVQIAQMESGLVWIGLFIALSPMLGFMGTVVGMVSAFDSIQAAGDISPTLVAGGIKVALLTTLAGLIAAVILQLFYSYIISKIDSLTMDMEDSSITLVDMLTDYNRKR
jgi:biopolymer transport protein ExbB